MGNTVLVRLLAYRIEVLALNAVCPMKGPAELVLQRSPHLWPEDDRVKHLVSEWREYFVDSHALPSTFLSSK